MRKYITLLLLFLLFSVFVPTAVFAAKTAATTVTTTENQAEEATEQNKTGKLDDLAEARIGVQTGTMEMDTVKIRFPKAKLSYFKTVADLVSALLNNKIDSFPMSLEALKPISDENSQISYLQEPLKTYECGFVFPKNEKGEKLCAEFNEFLEGLEKEGKLKEIKDKWMNSLDAEPVNVEDLPDTNGKLLMATEALYPPFEFVSNEQYAGFDIEIAAEFCKACGYGLEIVDMSFDGVIASIQTGKCDFAGSGIEITEERAQSVLFSNSYHTVSTVMVVLKEDGAGKQTLASFWNGIVSSFEKTFIREDRWRLFVEGILTTLQITLLSILFGTALGFLVYMACRNGNAAANLITRVCVWLVQGMPMVVLLMVLYYLIFGSTSINGIAVAVIGFTLTFGASVFGMLKMGVNAVDRGQYEAAYALGHTDRCTFFKIILPQAIPHILPSYQSEIVGLIKSTAIVGYIAVQDLTKMGDIVRSRTYEAFFPLIAITVIYFLLESLFGFAVSRIHIRFDPKKRNRSSILKGVNIHDKN